MSRITVEKRVLSELVVRTGAVPVLTDDADRALSYWSVLPTCCNLPVSNEKDIEVNYSQKRFVRYVFYIKKS